MKFTEKEFELAKYVSARLEESPFISTVADIAFFLSSKWFIYGGVLALYLLGYIQMIPSVAAFVFGIPFGALLVAILIAAIIVLEYVRGTRND